MLAKDIKEKNIYLAKVSGQETDVRVDEISTRPGYKRSVTRYACTNLATGRKCLIKAATKFRRLVKDNQ